MTTENFLEHIRSGQMEEEALKKHLGNYRPKDVEEYIEKLQAKLRNMEELYQERYEEMRTSLLAVTRERNDLSENVKQFEQKLKDIPKNCDTYLSEQGLLALTKKEYEGIMNAGAVYQKENAALNEKIAGMEKELARLQEKTDLALAEKKLAEEEAEKYKYNQLQMEKKAAEFDKLNAQLQSKIEMVSQKQAELDAISEQNHKHELELVEARAKYQMLEMQYRITQELNQQLVQEKDRQDKENQKRQERFNTERAYLIQRFNGILQNQKHFMQRLQDSVTAYVQNMTSIADADFLEMPDESSKQGVRVLNFSASAASGSKEPSKRD